MTCDDCSINLVDQRTWKKLPAEERACYKKAKTLAPVAARHPYRLCKRCWTNDRRRRDDSRRIARSVKRDNELRNDWPSLVSGGITYWQKPNETRAEFIERVNSRKRNVA